MCTTSGLNSISFLRTRLLWRWNSGSYFRPSSIGNAIGDRFNERYSTVPSVLLTVSEPA